MAPPCTVSENRRDRKRRALQGAALWKAGGVREWKIDGKTFLQRNRGGKEKKVRTWGPVRKSEGLR